MTNPIRSVNQQPTPEPTLSQIWQAIRQLSFDIGELTDKVNDLAEKVERLK